MYYTSCHNAGSQTLRMMPLQGDYSGYVDYLLID